MTNPWWYSLFRYQKESRASCCEFGRHPVVNLGQGSREQTVDEVTSLSGTFPTESSLKTACFYQEGKAALTLCIPLLPGVRVTRPVI